MHIPISSDIVDSDDDEYEPRKKKKGLKYPKFISVPHSLIEIEDDDDYGDDPLHESHSNQLTFHFI